MQLPVPVFCKNEQGSIKRLGSGVFAARRKGWVAVSVNDLGHLPVFNSRRAVPGLDDELVFRLHIAEDNDFQVGGIRERQDFPNGRHPPTDEAFKSFCCKFLRNFGKVLFRVVSPRPAGRKYRHGVKTLPGSHESVPRQPKTPATLFRVGCLRRSGRLHGRGVRIISALQEPVGQKIGSRQTDFVQIQAKVWGLTFREDGFGGFWQDALGALIRKKNDGAVPRSQVLIDFPVFA